ncbi:hypothetical protein CERZMDRAFT_95616 [Cercospora zeae-maydis SCOH1-5]|uniref:Uncharacterized protein n=1 Tax=Cercospora zeae-maydis SCOH1-5 TaxID=717836 RepID=A0A6A6FLS9_9PEZI|nr:hypothetical protein CERZMDRAFT_95616 [Cercospora zeae-maydis SCOH1-5]
MHLLWKATRQATGPAFSTSSTACGEALTKARFTQEERSMKTWNRISTQSSSKTSSTASSAMAEDDVLIYTGTGSDPNMLANWKNPKPRDLKQTCGFEERNEWVASCHSTTAAMSCQALGYCQARKYGGKI